MNILSTQKKKINLNITISEENFIWFDWCKQKNNICLKFN